MRYAVLLAALLASASALKLPEGIVCDADTDCLYVPAQTRTGRARVPALVVLSCVGAMPVDLDTVRSIGDSLGWVMATCHRTRNHRDARLNDWDIVRTMGKLRRHPKVDSNRVFLFGFSGQGVQSLATMFAHPGLVRGAVAVCPHDGAMKLADWAALQDAGVYVVTRQQDWNRRACEAMYGQLMEHGIRAELRVTPGEHGPGPCSELLTACAWLDSVACP